MEEDEGKQDSCGVPCLFQDLKVFVCGHLDEDTLRDLVSGQGNRKSYLSSLLNLVIVGRDPEECELNQAWEIFEDIPVVSQDWIRCCVKAGKRLPFEPFSIKSNSLFKGLSFSIARGGQLPKEDINILWELLVFNGAYNVSLELHSHSHYAINTRVVECKGPTLVTPDWVVESVKKKKLEDPALFHPKLLLKPGEVYISKKQTLINQLREGGIASIKTHSPKGKDNTPKTQVQAEETAPAPAPKETQNAASMTPQSSSQPVTNISTTPTPPPTQRSPPTSQAPPMQRHAPSPQQTTMVQQRSSPITPMKMPLPSPQQASFVHATKSSVENRSTLLQESSSSNTTTTSTESSVQQLVTASMSRVSTPSSSQSPTKSVTPLSQTAPSNSNIVVSQQNEKNTFSNQQPSPRVLQQVSNVPQVSTTTLQQVQPTLIQTGQANSVQQQRPSFISVTQSQGQIVQRGGTVHTIQRPLQQLVAQSVQVVPQNRSQVIQQSPVQNIQQIQGQSVDQTTKISTTTHAQQPQQIQIQPIQQLQVSQNGQAIQHVQLTQGQSIQVSQHQQGQQGQQTLRHVQLSQQQGQGIQQQQHQGQTLRQVQLTQQGPTLQHVQLPQQVQVSQTAGQTLQIPQQQGGGASQSTIQHVHISQQGQTIQVSQQQQGQPPLTRVTPRTIQGQQLIHTGQIQLRQGVPQSIQPQQGEISWKNNQVQQQQVIQQQQQQIIQRPQESNMQQQRPQVIQQLSVQQGTPTQIIQQNPQQVLQQGGGGGATQTLMQGGQQQQQQHVIQGPRQPSPHILRQQQIIQQHIAGLSMEQRASFTQMNPREKQQYLAARGLLLPHPTIRHTITLTDQQREMLQNMDSQQRQVFIAKLQKEKEMQIRQQMMQRQQQQQQQQGMVQQQQVMVSQQQQMWQQPNAQQQYRTVSHQAKASLGNNSNVVSQASPQVQNSQGMRPAWSGETRPALAQVPRTPQQMQRLQALQLQREQQQQQGGTIETVTVNQQVQAQQQQQQPRQQLIVNGPRPQMGQQMLQQQTQVVAQTQVQMQGSAPQSQQQQQYMQQIALQQQQQGNGNQTKVALANMLTNRLQQPGSTHQSGPQQGGSIVSSGQSQQMSVQDPSHVTRVHMMNLQQQQQQQQQIGSGTYVTQQATSGPPHQYFNVQQRGTLDNVTNTSQGGAPPGNHQNQVISCGVVASRFPGGVRVGIPRPGGPIHHPPRIQFYGHDPKLTLPADLCLLGCVFLVGDYQDSDESEYCNGWTRVIKQYGGEVEEEYHPRITHILCKNQDNSTVQQGLREGKRLVTVYWLNDIIVNKRVTPPWKAIHFPLPMNFEKPCENMLLTLTGFEGRDRDWVEQMIRLSGAKYSGYFSKHNHAIICRKPSGEKYEKAKEWKVPAVSVQWLNDVLFGNLNAVQCVNNPKYQNLKLEDPFRVDFSLLPHLVEAWKIPIRVTPETYQKFKANPPARIKRKVGEQKQEKEEAAKRMRLEGSQQQDESGMAEPQPTPESKPDVNGEGLNGSQPIEKNNEDEKENSALGGGTSDSGTDVKKIAVLLSGFSGGEYSNMISLIKETPFLVYTSDVSLATHLIMPKLCRTITFLKAVIKVKYILSYEWLKESVKEKTPQDEQKYLFHDEEFERTFKFSLSSTLARPERDKLFEGKIFYITPATPPSWKKIRSLVELAGGKVDNNRRKDLKQIKELNLPGEEPNYIIITCEADLQLVTDVLKAKIGVYNAEFVLSAVMRNKMDFDLSKSITTV